MDLLVDMSCPSCPSCWNGYYIEYVDKDYIAYCNKCGTKRPLDPEERWNHVVQETLKKPCKCGRYMHLDKRSGSVQYKCYCCWQKIYISDEECNAIVARAKATADADAAAVIEAEKQAEKTLMDSYLNAEKAAREALKISLAAFAKARKVVMEASLAAIGCDHVALLEAHRASEKALKDAILEAGGLRALEGYVEAGGCPDDLGMLKYLVNPTPRRELKGHLECLKYPDYWLGAGPLRHWPAYATTAMTG